MSKYVMTPTSLAFVLFAAGGSVSSYLIEWKPLRILGGSLAPAIIMAVNARSGCVLARGTWMLAVTLCAVSGSLE